MSKYEQEKERIIHEIVKTKKRIYESTENKTIEETKLWADLMWIVHTKSMDGISEETVDKILQLPLTKENRECVEYVLAGIRVLKEMDGKAEISDK